MKGEQTMKTRMATLVGSVFALPFKLTKWIDTVEEDPKLLHLLLAPLVLPALLSWTFVDDSGEAYGTEPYRRFLFFAIPICLLIALAGLVLFVCVSLPLLLVVAFPWYGIKWLLRTRRLPQR